MSFNLSKLTATNPVELII